MDNSQLLDLPKFSSSEERAFKTCRLAHHFEYDLGYRLQLANRKLSLGIIFHEGLAAFYQGHSRVEVDGLVQELCDERWEEILAANAEMPNYAESAATFGKDRELVAVMVQGYMDWVQDSRMDENYETVETEVSHLIVIPEAPCAIPVRMDLVQRNLMTGRLRVVDFKTAKNIPIDMTSYRMAEQNGNYQLACMAVFDERPTEMAYRFARKIIPSGRSKPPYFKEEVIHLSQQELIQRVATFRTVAEERFSDHAIYPQPENCCGSWKNDWRKPCLLVHQGYEPLEALEQSPGYELSDAYARYDDLEEEETE